MNKPLLQTLFPTTCALCRERACVRGEAFCAPCTERYRLLRAIPCHSCGLPASECICPQNQTVHMLLWYDEADTKRLVYMLKHRASRTQVSFLGKQLAALCSEYYDAVTYVPRSRKGLRRNGYDQSKLLAETVAKELQLPIVGTLVCLNPKEQKYLSESQRAEWVKGKFRALPEAVLQYPRLLLIDDICTTGATLNVCASLLRKAGAKAVFCGALAKTQRELPH